MRSPGMVRLFTFALRLYPRAFRQMYSGQILLTLADALEERRGSALQDGAFMFQDVVRSAVKERGRMLRDWIRDQRTAVHAVLLGVLFTACGFVAALTMQQMLRRDANQPQEQMAERYVKAAASGGAAGLALPQGHINMADSLEPFVIAFDESGAPLRSTAQLDGVVPRPPAGVFAYLREHPDDTFTWQPRRGVRIATVARRVPGGYILVGRSLETTEMYETCLREMVLIGWLLTIALLAAGAVFLRRTERRPQYAV